MFDLSPEKLLFLAVIAVMVLGPERLPKAARTFGRVLHQVRSTTSSLQSEMVDALAEPRQAISDAVGDLGLQTDLRGVPKVPRMPKMPKVPTARSLVTQALLPPVAAHSRDVGASKVPVSSVDETITSSVERPVNDALPDDPSLN